MHYSHFSDQKTDIRGLPCEVAPTRNGRKNWNWGFLPLKRLVWITTPRLFKFSLFPPLRCRHSLETERSRNGKERLTLRVNSVRPANAGSGGSRLHCRKWRSVVVTYSEQKASGGHLRWEGRDPPVELSVQIPQTRGNRTSAVLQLLQEILDSPWRLCVSNVSSDSVTLL